MTDERIVYQRRPRCTLCQQSPQALTEVHGVIWDVPAGSVALVPSMRFRTFAANAEGVLRKRGVSLTRQSITKHVEHVEKTARIRNEQEYATNHEGHVGERVVLASDYRSITDRTAELGMLAANQIENRIGQGGFDDKALVAVLTAGQRARVEEQKLDQRDRQHGDQMKALLLFGSGMFGALPEGEADGQAVPVRVLRAELEAERAGYYIEASYTEVKRDDDG